MPTSTSAGSDRPFYLGLDCSTQSLTAIVIDTILNPFYTALYDFVVK